ncbi:psbQ-like protein 3 [Carex littledalei]|uniref:PsbQ-like protein 3 n=1 Tax=Carex littledalei TaxID=544730 RepID=A0A833V154_9POAL|nr:psbQ-like protein 3 [Carex littledalei]
MASSHYTFTNHCPSLFHSFKTCSISYHQKNHECLLISRRYLTSISLGATLLYKDFFCATNNASSVEFQLMTPGQSPEEAKTQIKLHARNLLKIKPFIDSESWKEVRIALRESSSLLKQDLYTIIQTKPTSERGELRRLYSDLFNNVTTLINAAEDKDENQVQECYDNIATDLNKIFARI